MEQTSAASPSIARLARAAARALWAEPAPGGAQARAVEAAWSCMVAALALGALALAGALLLRCSRHAALESLWGSELSPMERSFALAGAPARFATAQAMAERAELQTLRLGLPGLRGAWPLSLSELSTGSPNSAAFAFGRLCLVDHGLSPDALPFKAAAMGGGDQGAQLAFDFAAAHELGHCAFRRSAGSASARQAADAFALPDSPSKAAAEAWLAKARAESFCDLLGLAALARALPPGDPRFASIGAYLIGSRTLDHLDSVHGLLMRSHAPGPGFDISELDEHFTQFALSAAMAEGQSRLASMDGPSLEAWALGLSLRSASTGARGAREFSWLLQAPRDVPAPALAEPLLGP